jgi:diaminopimelate epimerase
MKQLKFYKYQGTGNDFIMIDNRDGNCSLSQKQIENLCHRRFGIGADGLILLEIDKKMLKMVYFNSDGRESSMCGNGGRCFAAFAHLLKLVELNSVFTFAAIDGSHEAIIESIDEQSAFVRLKMINVNSITPYQNGYVLNTGSPHYVEFVDKDFLSKKSINENALQIRNNDDFRKDGINVNYVHCEHNLLTMRTFERGVEDETLSCGTGVTAAAISASLNTPEMEFKIKTPGGKLEVKFNKKDSGFEEIWLSGPAAYVYEGTINPELFA